jgi:uncharacterized FlaG/YvyC family protein
MPSTQAMIEKSTQQLEGLVRPMGRSINIAIDGHIGYHAVTVISPNAGEMIRQMPPLKLMKFAQSLPKHDELFLNPKA